MSFDNSRFTFNPLLDYFGVVMQQGRVQLDSDWNEWVAELSHRMHTGALDLIGSSGVPGTTPGGFNILAFTDSGNLPHITIGAGRIYVDGLVAENHGPPSQASRLSSRGIEVFRFANPVIDFAAQPYLPGAALTADSVSGKQFLVYLDVWQRDVSFLEDPDLVDAAVGVDTTGRRQTVWQVKLLDVTGLNFSPATPDGSSSVFASPDPATSAWLNLVQPPSGTLTNGTGGVALTTSAACALTPATGYTGLENQLYRIQIHQADNVAGTASFKWSRENASVSTLVTAMTTLATSGATQLTVDSLGRDQVLGFRPGDWIEIIDDVLELSTQAGELHLIQSIDLQGRTITLDSAVSPTSFPVKSGLTDPTRHTRILRWDQAGLVYLADGSTSYAEADNTGIPIPPPGTVLSLESGITAAFDNSNSTANIFQPGDFWIFSARATDGSIQILNAAQPHGVQHHYARLALVDFTSFQTNAQPSIVDLRRSFPTLANPAIHVTNVVVNNASLNNDGGTTIQSLLTGGLSVVCDSPLDHAILTQPSRTNSPIFSITLDLPSTTTIGTFNPTILPSKISINPPNTLSWQHAFDTVANPDVISSLEALVPLAGPPVLAHLALKGDAIWAAGNSNIFLNGTEDGRASADFNLWFWLSSQPVATLSATFLNFPGTQRVGTASDTQTVVLANHGGKPLTLNKVSITQSDGQSPTTDFAFALANGITLPFDLDPAGGANASLHILVTFTPSAAGNLAGILQVQESADGTSPLTVALNGIGIQSQLAADPSALAFPVQIVGTFSPAQTVTLTAGGSTQVTISTISILPPPGATFNQFILNSLPAVPFSLQPGATAQIQVSFHPLVAALGTGQLQIVHDAPNSPILIPLSGSAIFGAPVISPSTTSLGFGSVAVGATATLSLTLSNTGNSALLILGTGLTSSLANAFTIGSNCGTLQPGQSCTMTISFHPPTTGGITGQLQISHNAAGSPLLVNLSGVGMAIKSVAKDALDKSNRDHKTLTADKLVLEKIAAIEKSLDRTQLLQRIRPAAVVNLEALKAQELEQPATAIHEAFITPQERPIVGAIPSEPQPESNQQEPPTDAEPDKPKPE